MSRHHSDWLQAFLEYSSFGEAPRHMYFWTGVSAIAGALRRKVWIDQAYFRWYPNFYIVLVAPPGIVSKSTTAGIGMKLLRQVPGVRFGPDVVTWPALVTAFAEATEGFEHQGEIHTMSAMTLESSEFGNLLNPQDREMVDLLVSLWDGKQGSFEKKTKFSGEDSIQNPWINLIACTTPSWIAGNFPEYMIGGGFTSRTIFVYADKKEKYVAYPFMHTPVDLGVRERKLVEDLTAISNLAGEMRLSSEALEWGEAWYCRHYASRPANLDPDQFGGYLARKQTHIHKLAMVLSASRGDSLCITAEDLSTADIMVTDLEPDLSYVFSRIGRSEQSLFVEKLISFVSEHPNGVPFADAYRHIHRYIPSAREFEDFMQGAIKAGLVRLDTTTGSPRLFPGPSAPVPSAIPHLVAVKKGG